MGLATAKLTLAAKPDNDGLTDVRIRFTKDRVSRFVNVGVAILPKHWNRAKDVEVKKNWLFTGHREHAKDTAHLTAELERARDLIKAHPAASADELKAYFQRPRTAAAGEGPDFIAYYALDLERRALTDNPRTIGRRQTVLDKLRAATGGTPLPFSALTPAWVRAWRSAFLARYPHGAETIKVELSLIRGVYAQAVADGVWTETRDPFAGKVAGSKTTPQRARLSAEQLDQFESLPTLPPRRIQEAGRRNWPRLTYYIWLAQLYAQGARVGDVLEWRERHVLPDRLGFTERKTGNTKSVPRHPRLDAILAHFPPTGNPDAYVFPVLDHRAFYAQPRDPRPLIARQQWKALLAQITSAAARMSVHIKKLARHAGLPAPLAEALTTHSARHTFADLARRRLNGNVAAIKEMLNHSKLSITERYLSQLAEADVHTASLHVYGTLTGTTQVQHAPNTGELYPAPLPQKAA